MESIVNACIIYTPIPPYCNRWRSGKIEYLMLTAQKSTLTMVDELEIYRSSKKALKSTLKKFPTLFGGGLGLLAMEPVSIKLKEGFKPYQGRYYNIPKVYD